MMMMLITMMMPWVVAAAGRRQGRFELGDAAWRNLTADLRRWRPPSAPSPSPLPALCRLHDHGDLWLSAAGPHQTALRRALRADADGVVWCARQRTTFRVVADPTPDVSVVVTVGGGGALDVCRRSADCPVLMLRLCDASADDSVGGVPVPHCCAAADGPSSSCVGHAVVAALRALRRRSG